MISILASGILINAPSKRTSKSGNPFVTAQLRVSDNGESALVSMVAFDQDVCDSLLALSKGDTVIVSGPAKPTSWVSRDGSQAQGLNVVVKVLMTHYALTKKRKNTSDLATGLPPVNLHPGLKQCGLDNNFDEDENGAPF
jgi:single-stranded DNA-binding protein